VPTTAELLTPERVLFSGEAEFVVLRAEGGEIMFLPHHADFAGAVDICVVRIVPASEEEGGSEVRAAMAGGFVHVADNVVRVLASVAELADEIDVDRARRALEAAEAAEGEEPEEEAAPPDQPTDGLPRPGVPGEAGAGGEAPTAVSLPDPTMVALLHPDRPEVRARRARARLEAAEAVDSATSPAAAAH
jgi:F-type H+-transporting ATPase subunit epsilon